MELELKREKLRFERLAECGGEQIHIEGEATLPGSMRDAVTVLSVQAQAHITSAKAGTGEALLRGRAQFQVLYTQGDLTRVRALETSCEFDCDIRMKEVTPRMRISACVSVQETQGTAASGRVTLGALLDIQTEAYEIVEKDWIADVTEKREAGEQEALEKKAQRVKCCIGEILGENRTLVREEFDLPSRLNAGEVLGATAAATTEEFSGGNGKIGVSGVVQVRVLHRPLTAGNPLVMTQHDLPYTVMIDARLPEGIQPRATAEVMDVMADCAASGENGTLRVEAEVHVVLSLCESREIELLKDVYSLSGPILQPAAEELDVHVSEDISDVRESVRIQAGLPTDAPPIGTMLAAFALPTVAEAVPSGRRLDVAGVMSVTLIYLPVDSDIPCSIATREPFSMTFPVEAEEGVRVQAYTIETAIGPTTSDRAEIRCVLGLHVMQHGVQRVRGITEIEQKPSEKQEHGFVIVWPAPGESRWDTARRLRVREDSLHPAGNRALMAFKK